MCFSWEFFHVFPLTSWTPSIRCLQASTPKAYPASGSSAYKKPGPQGGVNPSRSPGKNSSCWCVQKPPKKTDSEYAGSMGSLDLRKDDCGDVSAPGGWLIPTLSFLLSFCYRFGLYVQGTCCCCCFCCCCFWWCFWPSCWQWSFFLLGTGAIKWCCCQCISATGAGGAAGVGTDVVLHTAM